MWNAQRGGFSSCTALCKTEKCNPGKNMIDQGPIFTRPTGVLQSAKCQEICWNNRSPQTDAQEVVWGGGGKDSPCLMYTSVSSCKHLRRYLGSNLHWKWGRVGGTWWRHLEKHGSLIGRHGLVWLDELWEFPAQLVKRWVRNEGSTYILVVGQTKTYLSFH